MVASSFGKVWLASGGEEECEESISPLVRSSRIFLLNSSGTVCRGRGGEVKNTQEAKLRFRGQESP